MNQIYYLINKSCDQSNNNESQQCLSLLNEIETTNYLTIYSNLSNIIKQSINLSSPLHIPTSQYIDSLLQIIINNQSMSNDGRLLASILLKNVIIHSYVDRGGKNNVIIDSDKIKIKQFLLSYLTEPEIKISSQLSIIASKIARHDWPDRWNDLFSHLITNLQNTSTTCLSNESDCYIHRFTHRYMLEMMLEVLNELSSKTLSFAKSSFALLCVELFPIVVSLWNSYIDRWIQKLGLILNDIVNKTTNFQTTTYPIDIEYLSIYLITSSAILSKLLQLGFYEISRANYLPNYFNYLTNYLPELLNYLVKIKIYLLSSGVDIPAYSDVNYKTVSEIESYLVVVLVTSRVTKEIGNQPVKIQKDYPLDTSPYLLPFLTFYSSQLVAQTQVDRRAADDVVSIIAVNFLSNVLSCQVYIESNDSTSSPIKSTKVSTLATRLSRGLVNDENAEYNDNQSAMQGYYIRYQFFQDNYLKELLDICLSNLLVYSNDQLDDWINDPETFYNDESNSSIDDNLYAASQNLFLSLLDFKPKEISTYLSTYLLDKNQQIQLLSGVTNDRQMALYHSIYLCAGLGVATISQYLNANDWLNQTLGPILQELFRSPNAGSLSTGQQLLRCRVIWTLGCWLYNWDSNILLSIGNLLVLLYSKSSSSDLTTRLICLSTLDALLTSNSFTPEPFSQILLTLVESLCTLIIELTDIESKSRVVNTIKEIARSMDRQIVLMLQPLVNYLVSLWVSCEEDNRLFKRSIVESLTASVRSSGSAVLSIVDTILPVIQSCILGSISSNDSNDNANEDGDYLLSDGVSLWLALMRNTTTYSIALDNLLRSVLVTVFSDGCVIDINMDVLKDLLLLVECYALLEPAYCLNSCSEGLALMFNTILGQVSSRLVSYVIRPLEAFALTCPIETSTFTYQSNCFHRMLQSIASYLPGLQTAMSEFNEPESSIVIYLSYYNRILLTNRPIVIQSIVRLVDELINKQIVNQTTTVDMIYKSIVKLQLDMYDGLISSNGGNYQRKVWCLSLLANYPSDDNQLVDWFIEILYLIDSLLSEDQLDNQANHFLLISNDEIDNRSNDPIVSVISNRLSNDIINQTNLLVITKEKIQSMYLTIGSNRCDQLLNSLDINTRQRLIGS